MWRPGLVQVVESYRLWPEGPGFELWYPRIAQARVRLATNTLPQPPHRAGALCTGYAFFLQINAYAVYYMLPDECKLLQNELPLIVICPS